MKFRCIMFMSNTLVGLLGVDCVKFFAQFESIPAVGMPQSRENPRSIQGRDE